MDDIVRDALNKWPNVPACYQWLALDARGDWYMRDERIQAAGAFPHPKGSRIDHAKLRAFIERNYEATPEGAWYFQNGPQRVYVDLEAAPWVLRASGSSDSHSWASHTGLPLTIHRLWIDQADRVFASTTLGLGIIHSQDMLVLANQVQDGRWPEPRPCPWEELLAEHRVVVQPRPV